MLSGYHNLPARVWAVLGVSLCLVVLYVVHSWRYERETVDLHLNPGLPSAYAWKLKRCKVNESAVTRSYSQGKQDLALWDSVYKNTGVCGGTYVEIGALDGVSFSNTKFYEDALRWSGVLIEAEPDANKLLKQNRPRNEIFQFAACPQGQSTIEFAVESAGSHLKVDMFDKEGGDRKTGVQYKTIPCYPGGMGGMLKQAGVAAIDFFSLDVEDSELIVLESMHWDIPVGVFLIEFANRNPEKDRLVRELLLRKGYVRSARSTLKKCTSRNCFGDQAWEHPLYRYYLKSLGI